ncbi:MAG: M81 family metallopeptidase [Pirellulales bacterium]
MRIAIAQLWQETNTFNTQPTLRADFESFGVLAGDELVEKMADTNELGGFIQSVRSWSPAPDVVGLVRLPAWPSGRATAGTFHWLRDEIADAVRRRLPLDAVLLALHGAMVADEFPDVEGHILEAVRGLVGPGVPIVATLDLHANVTERMARQADALVLFHTAPHIDVFETGQRGAEVLRRILFEGARPVTAFQKIPAVVPAERANTQNPASISYGFNRRLVALERDRRILAAGLATVQPWLDIPELGSSVVVVADGDRELASEECRRLAGDFWLHRRDYLPELTDLEAAVREAHDCRDGLVVLGDGADSTTSGAPGDSNWLLKEFLKYDWPRPVLLPLVAPDVVDDARRSGAGSAISASLGGKLDSRFSTPLVLDVRVERLFDARFVLSGHLARNLPIDMGPSAVLRHGNIHIVATSRSGPHFAPELFRCGGLDPFSAAVLVAKSPCGFRAAYQPHAKKIIMVRAPGCAPSDFWNYEYRNITRPLWPWDELPDWQPKRLLIQPPP